METINQKLIDTGVTIIKSETNQLFNRNDYDYLWINTIESLELLYKTHFDEVLNQPSDELIEAKFFNKKKEVTFINIGSGPYKQIERKHSENAKEYSEEYQSIKKNKLKYIPSGDRLVVRKYFDKDQDGQYYIGRVMLYDVVGGIENGSK